MDMVFFAAVFIRPCPYPLHCVMQWFQWTEMNSSVAFAFMQHSSFVMPSGGVGGYIIQANRTVRLGMRVCMCE